MYTFADKADVSDMHIAKVRFGGDIGLKPGTERFTEQVSEHGKEAQRQPGWFRNPGGQRVRFHRL